ncbi:MAG: ABC transporter permease [Defluviitaleaceae bacterium]|nr:ABC transporter permease [Defluviitaleaceae bacterium]
MGNIITINLKTALVYKWRILVFVAFVAVLSVGSAVVAGYFWHGQNLPPIYVAIVDQDNSLETMLILTSMQAAEEYADLIEFVVMSEIDAYASLNDGYVTALVTFPPGFGHAMTVGQNMPFFVNYNQNAPLTTAMVRIVADAFADMLMYSQMGVYTVLDYAAEANITPEQYNLVFWGINLQFLGMVLERHNIFHEEMLTPNQVPLVVSFFIAAYIALMLSAFFVLSDIIASNFTKHNIISLVHHGERLINIIFGCALVYFALLGIVNILLFGVLVGLGVLNITLPIFVGLFVINFIISIFGTTVTFLFKTSGGRGVFMVFFVAISLLLSGGIIPLEFLAISTYWSFVTFNYWGSRVLQNAYLGQFSFAYLGILLLFGLLFFLLPYFKLYFGYAKKGGA